MKKIYFFVCSVLSLLFYSQPYSYLLKNTDWKIVKIHWAGIDYYPPPPLMMSGTVKFNDDDNNAFKSTFFNTAGGTVSFGDNNANYFNLQNIAVTLAQYGGENAAAVQQFDEMTTGFYFDYQQTDPFYFDYQEVFSGRNLTVTNPLGYKIYYSNKILGSNEISLNQPFSIYPNPAKDHFYVKSSKNNLKKVNARIYDVSGRLVSSQKVNVNEPVNVQDLSDGNYFLQIVGSEIRYSSKLTIKK